METPAEALRLELKGLLSDLDEEIRTSFPACAAELSRRAALAEVHVVRELGELVALALLGGSAPARCTTPGQAYDLRDALAVAARDVRIERERREAELAAAQSSTWPSELHAAFQSLLDDERRVCEHLQEGCGSARERAAALRVVVSNLADVCLDALVRAARLPDAEGRRRVAAEAARAAEAAAEAWLRWREAQAAREQAHWRRCAPLRIPQLLLDVSLVDGTAAAFLTTVRTAMKLRRQQLRLVAVQQRLAAVLAACDVLASLRERVRFS